MKKRFLFPVILCAAIMTACSSSDNASGAAMSPFAAETNGASKSYSQSYVNYDSAEVPADPPAANNSEEGLAADELKKEMLVYSCTMSIDTLDFAASVDSFKSTLDMYGGFIEQENYSDGGANSSWYSESSQKWQTYTATLRVPSKNYDDFCDAAAQLGDLRSKNARVENVSREYSDLQTSLEIYEAKEDRYIAMLSEIKDDEYAIKVEEELTDLQIEIAKIRTRMNEIKTDVAYSYVYITFREVREYTSEPIKTDTFGDRLIVTLRNAGRGFLSFLEGLLFIIIYLAPYLVLIGIIAAAVISIIKAVKRRRARKFETQAEKETEQVSEDTENKKD